MEIKPGMYVRTKLGIKKKYMISMKKRQSGNIDIN